MDELLYALGGEVAHVHWPHFSEPSKSIFVHGSLSAKRVHQKTILIKKRQYITSNLTQTKNIYIEQTGSTCVHKIIAKIKHDVTFIAYRSPGYVVQF